MKHRLTRHCALSYSRHHRPEPTNPSVNLPFRLAPLPVRLPPRFHPATPPHPPVHPARLPLPPEGHSVAPGLVLRHFHRQANPATLPAFHPALTALEPSLKQFLRIYES